jgi:RHS repeat-associated protein
MKRIYAVLVATVLILGFTAQVGNLAGLLDNDSEGVRDQSFDQLRHVTLQDGIPALEKDYQYGVTDSPTPQVLEIQTSDDSSYDYMARSPYYKIYFKGGKVRMIVQDAWVEFELVNQDLGDIQSGEQVKSENTLSVSDVFASVDLSYEVESSLLKETLILEESKLVERVIQEISWGGVTPEFKEDGSILFKDENGKEILGILPPFMEDAHNSVCTDVHYELVETETGYELHKVIDDTGLEWLQNAVYPVVIDPSMQTFEDAWESSGFQPYGQYFKNFQEYVNPANGHLTITNTDLVIPGRGLDLVISRMYETLAVFYQAEPYEYTPPPVNVGKGWTLNFPYIGDDYFYFWGGTAYKMEWVGSTFENHIGAHFILVKNLDNTYTLTMANGNVCEFDTYGKLTQYKDVDLNTITFTYTSGVLTSITDTIGRTVTFTYSGGYLWKIIYNGAELEYGYDGNGNLIWMDDFLNRRTNFYYNAGWYEWADYGSGYGQKYNVYLLSKVVYPTTGYTTYAYDRFSYEDVYGDDGTCLDYFKYYVTDQKVYETNQVRHTEYTFTGNFTQITSCTHTVKNQFDVIQGSYQCYVDSSGLIYQKIIKNASGTPLRKFVYTHNSKKELTQQDVYNDGSNLSYTNYYAYDNWGNTIYSRNAEGHEQFFSYANTSTSGFFISNTGTVIKTFTNAFSIGAVPSSVHTVLVGTAEKQDVTYVREIYLTYDSKAHPTQSKNAFGNATSYLTFSGTFNEKTGSTSFPIDLTGHTVTGNAVLQITGLPSDDTYQENHSYGCPCNPTIKCTWTSGSWSNKYYSVHWLYCKPGFPPECDDGWASIGPFTHYPGTLGYQSYYTTPSLGGQSHTFTVTTNWKAYPAQVQYNLDGSPWEIITTNLQNTTVTTPVTIAGGSHSLYFSESSSKNTKFSWYLYVPVDNSPDTYTTTITHDTYGNVTSTTDPESNTVSLTYSATYSYAYLTEISFTVGTETITTKATYDSNRGWITSIQEPKGVQAGSGFDYLFTYDLLGRITRKEFPLLPGQSQRSYLEAVYDDINRTVTIIDQLRNYQTRHYDKLERLMSIKWYTGIYGSGTLYADQSYTYQFDDSLSTITDPGNDTYTYAYDFLGRNTQITYPDSVSVSSSYDDTSNKIIFTNGRGYDTIYWYDWLSRLTRVEEEYAADTFAVTAYQYDEIGHLTSITDAEDHTTSYTYASIIGLTKTTYPDSEYEEYEYDNVGNITSFTDCKGNETTYTFDDAYRLTQIQYQDQSTVSFTYDLNSNRIRMDDDAPNTGDYVEYSFDYWNRLTTETRHISTSTYAVSYQYDTANRLTSLTYPDGMQILYSYDDLNRVAEVKRYVDGSNDEILLSNAQYNTESLLSQFDYGNNMRAAFSYDSMDRPLSIDVKNGETSFLDLDYTYDGNSNITQLVNGWRDTNSTWHLDTESYSYDGLDRLTSANCSSWSHTYSYDEVGNRTAKDGVTYTLNTINEVTSLSDGSSFIYDSNGNRTQKIKELVTWDYTYDFANRLIKVEENDTTLGEYTYDGAGRRIQVSENSDITTLTYSGLNILYEENIAGTAAYIYGPTGRLAKRTTINQETSTFYYHTDQLGSTRLVTDNSRNIITAVAYHPFGEPSGEEGSEPYLFTGKERDSTGLYHYGARSYDPCLGRFITRDPLTGTPAIPQSLNRYAYCANNPLKYTDLTGLSYSFADEEIEEELNKEEGIGTEYGSDPLIIQIDDDEYIVYDVWGWSGNVVVGYGYVMSYTDNTAHLKTGPVLCVVELDDEGNVVNKNYWDAKDADKWNSIEFANKLDEVVSDENLQDLSNALNGLRKAIAEKLDVPWWKPVTAGAIISGTAGYLAGGAGPQAIPPAILAALIGGLVGAGEALIRWIENHRWQERNNFLANLLIDDLGKTTLPPPL